MPEQGSRHLFRWYGPVVDRVAGWVAPWLAAIGLLVSGAWCQAEPVELRLRLEWGGATTRQWQGQITVSDGTLVNPMPLGVEADTPGSMWCRDGVLEIRQRSRRSYDGVDVTVLADTSARLVVDLSPTDEQVALASVEIPLSSLVAGNHNSQLDEQGNRLFVRRTPGDALRVQLKRDALVFSPGDLLDLDVTPYLLSAGPQTRIALSARLTPARGQRTLWSEEVELAAPADDRSWQTVSLTVKLPDQEGAYDLHLEALRRSLTNRIGLRQTVAARKIQVVMVSAAAPPRPPAGSKPAMELLAEIDPTSPGWWDRIRKSVSLWPLSSRRAPLTSGSSEPWAYASHVLTRLGAARSSTAPAWDAFPLPVQRTGQPHVLEVEYPADRRQALGISLLEPNSAGAVYPIGLDSGVYHDDDLADAATGLARHRLLFWPRTEAPLLLLTNRRRDTRAAYGKIRLYGPRASSLPTWHWENSAPTGLPPALDNDRVGGRTLAGYFDRPLFVENFSATQGLDEPGAAGRCLDDWQTFYEGGTRLVEFLSHQGRNALMMSVVADGSTIYPSQLLEPTPRYDDGVYFSTGQDPLRKDVLELLFRLCNREGIKLVPAVQFTAPLPQLEAILRAETVSADSLAPRGADGSTWMEAHRSRGDGQGPFYNVLDPRVQDAMLAVIRELTARYRHHPSFGGLAVQLSADGYTQLPGADWGLDTDTVTTFYREALGQPLPEEGPSALSDPHHPQRAAWLAWRAGKLTDFYRRVAQEVTAARADTRLYLATVHIVNRWDLQRQLQPALPRTTAAADVLLSQGVDLEQLGQLTRTVVTRSLRLADTESLPARAANLEWNHAHSLDRRAAETPDAATLFFHEPTQTRIPEFDAASPFQPTFTRLVAQASPAGARNRQRFAHALALLDARTIFDGGWLLATSQDDGLADFVALYRHLPNARFETLVGACQPVVVRYRVEAGKLYVYAVNNSPWPARLTVDVSAGSGALLEPLVARLSPGELKRDADQTVWQVALPPFGLVAGRISDPQAELAAPRVQLNDEVDQRAGDLLQELWARAATLQSPPLLSLVDNLDFESTADEPSAIVGWEASPTADATARLDKTNPRSGAQCVRLFSQGETAWLRSAPFEPPPTCRLSVSVWLRTTGDVQPPLRLAIEGEHQGQVYYRHAPLGAGAGLQPVHSQWSRYVFRVADLPFTGLSNLRVRFDLVGAGEVWIDDIQLTDLEFSDNERLELAKMLEVAGLKLQRREYSELLRMLEGYWPRFLQTYVTPAREPLVQRPAGAPPAAPPTGAAPANERSATMFERVRRVLPGFVR